MSRQLSKVSRVGQLIFQGDRMDPHVVWWRVVKESLENTQARYKEKVSVRIQGVGLETEITDNI